MPFFTSPNAFHNANFMATSFSNLNIPAVPGMPSQPAMNQAQLSSGMATPLPPHSSHPALPRLTMLVFEAVLEVVCVSLPGYIIARQGMFTAEMQKFAANLNVTVFTPCLIFTKLASQLTTDKLADLAIIPLIFIVQTLISYLCSIAVSKAFGFSKRPRNFVIAMGVFGNSNSLPISLVLSLSQTIKGLHWNNVPGDNDDEVAARGILYLLIFQQLGQLVRWSWGYNVLLAPAEKVKGTAENANSRLETGEAELGESEPLMRGSSTDGEGDEQDVSGSDDTRVESRKAGMGNASGSQYGSEFRSGQQTPETHRQHTSSFSTACSSGGLSKSGPDPDLLPTPANGNIKPAGRMMSFPSEWSKADPIDGDVPQGLKGIPMRCRTAMKKATCTFSRFISKTSGSAFGALPGPLQRGTTKIATAVGRFLLGVWSFMNPPLWAMLVAIVVASIPDLQRFFFANGTFFKNSVTSAIRQSGGVAVPLILVVLGGNLARNTLPADPSHTREDEKEETKLLIASIISRMLLPFIIMAPLLAVTAKYVPVSILDDPIFVIVCFLITGAPSALQLAQICQINNVYMGAMSRLLFQSYVVWILPSTLVLVMCALEVVEWAQR
ncbi:hypothetical protein HO173_003490 [Letharia columbiana]|uniref:Auxin efflux carrier n=1 Tax=Letharia columbiana TaxID=112416 RepID=A0A8H6G102_9LECA|nr:uncharacterized protein HO173_003490 [Letharia columbiana]KAF6238521.1 hypothetical protein HO173_003490 [Letharia columbiana]